MKKLTLTTLFLLMALSALNAAPAIMQAACNTLPPRLTVGQGGQVSFTDGQPLNVRASADRSSKVAGLLPEGTPFDVLEGPTCAGDINWWRIQSGAVSGWVAEASNGVYLVEPKARPLPTSAPIPLSQGVPFAAWDWAAFSKDNYGGTLPDPLTITPPAVYAGSLPNLPVDLHNVLFVGDAALKDSQKTLLARNGFVVVPAGFNQFDEGYSDSDTWNSVPANFDFSADPTTQPQPLGNPYFITSDSMLHALHYVFDNLLTDLEREALITRVQNVVTLSLDAAAQQYQQALGTPLQTPARNAVLYLLVAEKLLAPDSVPTDIDQAILDDAEPLAAMAQSGEGQAPVPFLQGYTEDFSQYRPRGHYAGDPTLESYFRGMMWLSRITFRANDDAETLTALLLLRALHSQSDAYTDWQTAHDTLTFLIGPVDDLGPPEYSPLASEIFGADLSLASLGDAAKLAAFRDRLKALPGPRINGLVLPNDTQVSDVENVSRGFRLMGQRFTFDGYVLQQLMSPYVGTRENPRPLPLGLDVPAAMGSESAYTLAAQAGALNFQHYDTQMASLRGQIASLTQDNWLENTYSGWLWALQPLWVRDPALYPPLMRSEAWLRKDLQTGLASWTELKHDTVLYAKQPTGFGGGGPPLASYGYVEPNPLVFARISAVAALTFQGLTDRGIVDMNNIGASGADLAASAGELRTLAFNAAGFAQMAHKELAGQPLTEDEYYEIQTYGTYLNILLRTLYQGEGEPDPVALVTDVASNPGAQSVLQEGVGGVDYIYVVIPAPDGRLQVARGAVFSYYEFVGSINQRMTDQDWRGLVQSGKLPPRPAWVSAFFGE
jgi:hypothetical protein